MEEEIVTDRQGYVEWVVHMKVEVVKMISSMTEIKSLKYAKIFSIG